MQPSGLGDIVGRETNPGQWTSILLIATVMVLLVFVWKRFFASRIPQRPAIDWVPLRGLRINVHSEPPSWDDLIRAQRTAASDREDFPSWIMYVPPGLDLLTLGARSLYQTSKTVAPLAFVRESLRRNWSPSDVAEAYANKVRHTGRDLVAEEVAQLDALRAATIKGMNAPRQAASFSPS